MAVFGLKGWLRFHDGAVGAVRVIPEKMQVWDLLQRQLHTLLEGYTLGEPLQCEVLFCLLV